MVKIGIMFTSPNQGYRLANSNGDIIVEEFSGGHELLIDLPTDSYTVTRWFSNGWPPNTMTFIITPDDDLIADRQYGIRLVETKSQKLTVYFTPSQMVALRAAAEAHNSKGNMSQLVADLLAGHIDDDWPAEDTSWGRNQKIAQKPISEF